MLHVYKIMYDIINEKLPIVNIWMVQINISGINQHEYIVRSIM